jgi:hypothetical protein
MAEDPICDVPLDLVRFTVPLANLARHLANNLPITIVAIGSSSTEGDGTADPAVSSYPARLEATLKRQLPGHAITVLNKGAGGEEADTELLRFDGDVIAQNPTLVIWQVGTNAVWKSYDLNKVGDAIVAGLQKLATCRTDIILMDLAIRARRDQSRKARLRQGNEQANRGGGPCARRQCLSSFRSHAPLEYR